VDNGQDAAKNDDIKHGHLRISSILARKPLPGPVEEGGTTFRLRPFTSGYRKQLPQRQGFVRFLLCFPPKSTRAVSRVEEGQLQIDEGHEAINIAATCKHIYLSHGQ